MTYDSYGVSPGDGHVSNDSAHGLVDDEIAESSSIPFNLSAASTEDQLAGGSPPYDNESSSSRARHSTSGKLRVASMTPERTTTISSNATSPFAKGRKHVGAQVNASNTSTPSRRSRSLHPKTVHEGATGGNLNNEASTSDPIPNTTLKGAIHLMPKYLVSAAHFSAMWETLPMSSSDTLTFSAMSGMTYETMKGIASKHFHSQGFKIMAFGVTEAGVTLYIYGASEQTRPDTEDSSVVFLGEIRIYKGDIDDIWELHYVCKCTDSAHSTAFFRLLDFDALLSSPGLDDL
jgi:hypothetical protein